MSQGLTSTDTRNFRQPFSSATEFAPCTAAAGAASSKAAANASGGWTIDEAVEVERVPGPGLHIRGNDVVTLHRARAIR